MAVAELITENTGTVLLFVVTLVVLLLVQNARRPAGFPPGPPALPIIGNVLAFRSSEPLHKVFLRLSKKYGRLFSLKLGSYWVVVLNDVDDIREAIVKQPVDFAGRPKLFSAGVFSGGFQNISFSDYSPEWNLHRKLGQAALRHFAHGAKIDELLHGVLPDVAEVLDGSLGKPFDPKALIDRTIFIIIATMCYGKRYHFEDPHLTNWFDVSKDTFKTLGTGLPRDFIHSLKYLPRLPQEKTLRKLIDQSTQFIYDEFKGHRESFDQENIRDLFDSLIAAQKEAVAEGGSKADFLTDTRIIQTITDIFGAGTATVIPTLYWAIALMVEHPDVLHRVTKEIDEIIGQDRLPSVSDRGSMPYTEAVLTEVNRYGSAVPVGLPKSVTQDTTLRGYKIPKDTLVMVNVWKAHRDPQHWDEPFKFKPERFLDESGTQFLSKMPAGYLPFGLGRRACIGENFAKGEIFILFCWLFAHYSFSKTPGREDESLLSNFDRNNSFVNVVVPFEVIVKKR